MKGIQMCSVTKKSSSSQRCTAIRCW